MVAVRIKESGANELPNVTDVDQRKRRRWGPRLKESESSVFQLFSKSFGAHPHRRHLAYLLGWHRFEMILHEPPRHKEHAFDVQRADIILDVGFADELLWSSEVAVSRFLAPWKRRPDNLSGAGGNSCIGNCLPLGFFHLCGDLLPV